MSIIVDKYPDLNKETVSFAYRKRDQSENLEYSPRSGLTARLTAHLQSSALAPLGPQKKWEVGIILILQSKKRRLPEIMRLAQRHIQAGLEQKRTPVYFTPISFRQSISQTLFLHV